MIGEIDNPVLAKKIQDAIKRLKKTDSLTVQDRLSKLRDEVRARKQPYTENEFEK